MDNEKLGFTFYPNDWWTSKTFFKLDVFERYIYLECLFIMYRNNGILDDDKAFIEARLRTEIKTQTWEKITEFFTKTENGFTSPAVNKRLRKTLSNRENGKKGGRPPKPKKPNSETQKNPPLEREEERESEIENEVNIEYYIKQMTSNTSNWEVFCMNKRLTSTNNGLRLLREFLTDNMDNLNRPLSEIKKHFVNWLNRLDESKKNPIHKGTLDGFLKCNI